MCEWIPPELNRELQDLRRYLEGLRHDLRNPQRRSVSDSDVRGTRDRMVVGGGMPRLSVSPRGAPLPVEDLPSHSPEFTNQAFRSLRRIRLRIQASIPEQNYPTDRIFQALGAFVDLAAPLRSLNRQLDDADREFTEYGDQDTGVGYGVLEIFLAAIVVAAHLLASILEDVATLFASPLLSANEKLASLARIATAKDLLEQLRREVLSGIASDLALPEALSTQLSEAITRLLEKFILLPESIIRCNAYLFAHSLFDIIVAIISLISIVRDALQVARALAAVERVTAATTRAARSAARDVSSLARVDMEAAENLRGTRQARPTNPQRLGSQTTSDRPSGRAPTDTPNAPAIHRPHGRATPRRPLLAGRRAIRPVLAFQQLIARLAARLSEQEIRLLRRLQGRFPRWLEEIGTRITNNEIELFHRGSVASRNGVIGRLRGAIQELFIPLLPDYEIAMQHAVREAEMLGRRLRNAGGSLGPVRFMRLSDNVGELTDGVIAAVETTRTGGKRLHVFAVFEAKSKSNFLDLVRELGSDDYFNFGQIENSLARLETGGVKADGELFHQIIMGSDRGGITQWLIVAPFDIRREAGFARLVNTLTSRGRRVMLARTPFRNVALGQLAEEILVTLGNPAGP
jgi:hypothetical protein